MFSNPNGVMSQSPGLALWPTLGKRTTCLSTPNGVMSQSPGLALWPTLGKRTRCLSTPTGLWRIFANIWISPKNIFRPIPADVFSIIRELRPGSSFCDDVPPDWQYTVLTCSRLDWLTENPRSPSATRNPCICHPGLSATDLRFVSVLSPSPLV